MPKVRPAGENGIHDQIFALPRSFAVRRQFRQRDFRRRFTSFKPDLDLIVTWHQKAVVRFSDLKPVSRPPAYLVNAEAGRNLQAAKGPPQIVETAFNPELFPSAFTAFLSLYDLRWNSFDFPVLDSQLPHLEELWLGAESNRRHEDFQSSALPTELPSRRAASREYGMPGFLRKLILYARSNSIESISPPWQ